MHRATLAISTTKFTTEKFCQHACNRDTAHVGPAVSTVRGDDVISWQDSIFHADTTCFLTIVKMAETTDN